MQDTKNALTRLADAIRGMDDYNKGRLVGIGEGMILAGIGRAENTQPQTARSDQARGAKPCS